MGLAERVSRRLRFVIQRLTSVRFACRRSLSRPVGCRVFARSRV